MSLPQLTPSRYNHKVFRNIFTCEPPQHLMDDICPPEDYQLIERLGDLTSNISHQLPQYHRAFQYANIFDVVVLKIFERENWHAGRFDDGRTYGVWYSAEDELTSAYEACWISFRLAVDNVLPHGEVYTTDRAMYRADIISDHACDLSNQISTFPDLVHPYNYIFSQNVGKLIVEKHFTMMRSISARKINGICCPIFTPKIINNVVKLYNLTIHVNPNKTISVNSAIQPTMNFTLELSDIEDPHGLLCK